MLTTTNDRDQTLFQRISEGDEQAFYQFYTEYRPQLRSFALQVTRTDADADDVLQETFMRIWLSRDTLTSIDKPRSWVFTVNARVCLEYVRRKLSHKKRDSLGGHSAGADPATPFDLAHVNEIAAVIQQTIERMPAQRRRIFRLSRDDGKKPAEIAEILGISNGTVRNVLMTALKEVREGLIAAGYTLSSFIIILLL